MKQTLLNIAALVCLASLTLTWAAGSSANLSWIPPTTYTDGTTIDSIDHYTITWAPAAGQSGPSGSLNVAAPASSAVVNVPCGSTSFTLSVTTGATAKYPNATSSPTGPVPYVSGITCAPNPPAGLAAH